MSGHSQAVAALYEAFAREMAGAIAALVGESTSVVTHAGATSTAWRASLAVSGELEGTLALGLSEEDGQRISALIMGFEGQDVGDDAVLDTLREICGQAIGALGQKNDTAGIRLAIESVARGVVAGPDQRAWQFTLPSGTTPVIVVAGDLAEATSAPAGSPPATRPEVPASGAAAPAQPPAPANLDLLLDLELPLSVRFGHTELTLHTLTRLGPGSVIDLHRSADEPVEVLVSGKVIARGEVVVVDGNYGVRVTEVVSTAERIRSLGA